MRTILSILILLMLLPSVIAVTNVDVSLAGEIKITNTGTGRGTIRDLTAKVDLVPLNDQDQTSVMTEMYPEGQLTADAITYAWSLPPNNGMIEYGYKAKVAVENPVRKVNTKVTYPIDINDIPKQNIIYLKPSKNADSTSEAVANMARSIAGEDDDLWIVANKLAIWTQKNIKYDLSTLTAEVSQSASWTLQNRIGVCDELTTLFIAMNRALGIPARFVKGLAYVPDNKDGGWSMHGWAEVYFPNYGWVPFDVTFAQYGQIDSSHVQFQMSEDPDIASVDLQWRGDGVNAELLPLKIEGKLTGEIAKAQKQAEITPTLYKEKAGFGSYNLLSAKIYNTNEYYVTAHTNLLTPKEIHVQDGAQRDVILGPRETKYVFYSIKISSDLEQNKEYEIPLVLTTSLNSNHPATLKTSRLESVYTQLDISKEKSLLGEQLRKGSPTNSVLDCSYPRTFVYTDEDAYITCKLHNTDVLPWRDVNVCLNRKCETITLEAGETRTLKVAIDWQYTGTEQFSVIAKNDKISQMSVIPLEVLDKPDIELKIDAPGNISYGKNFNIKLSADKKSHSMPQNLIIVLKNGGWTRTLNWGELEQSRDTLISFDSTELSNGPFEATATWNDNLGREYRMTAQKKINISDISWMQRVGRFFYLFFVNLKESF